MPAPSSDQVQRALFRIAELASAAQNMREFYSAVHSVVGELMYAGNFFIALYDEERQLISWPYYVDEIDFDTPDPNQWDVIGTGEARGTTAYVLRSGEPQLLSSARMMELVEQGEVALLGGMTDEASFLGVPLKAEGRTVGVLVVQSYTQEFQYTEHDKALLAFVGQHVGAALSRARAIEETRQRNAELALINSVQEALAGELELQAIYDVVGDKLRDVFDAQVVDIGIYDEATGLLHFPYTIERGVRFPDEPIELIGFRRHVLESRESLLIDEDLEGAAARYGNPVLSGEMPKSVLYVPLVAGGKATGVISLQNIDREHAFAASDQQLLETLARSLSVALETARLVHETRQRNAELALINSVQTAIAGELNPQAIYDSVGEKIEEIYDAQAVSIATYDETTGLLSFPYLVERGERYDIEPRPVVGFRKHVLETGQPLMFNENVTAAAERYGNPIALVGEVPKSVLFVPLFSGSRASGVISLQNVDREHAFSESDQRLLLTLAGSIGAALENARLVEETQQRNAELALINSVQAAIAGELDAQAIYDLVGDRLQEVFDAQVVSISVYDEKARLLHFPYVIERGERLQEDPIPLIGFRRHVIETREPLMIEEATPEVAERYGNPPVLSGEPVRSCVFVPLIVGGRATGVVSLQNVDRTHAFTVDDQRLLTTLAGSLSVALDNARLVHETRQRNAELALINSVQESIAGELDPQAIYDLVGDKLREVFDAQVVDIAVREGDVLRYVYQIERGVHFPNVTLPVIGFRKHVMETREQLYIDENIDAALVEYGNPETIVGEPSHGSGLFQPLLVGGRPTGAISIQNLDREHAFSDTDRRLLATIAGSLGVALENAQLIHETRQRVAELATVNSIGQALASQLELEALIELVGDRIRETFDADLAYVALYDEPAGRIDFVYYHEAGVRRSEPSMHYGEGLTSQILESRAPLLLNRDEQLEGRDSVLVGTPTRSYLGVPILVGEKAIGVISVQSIHEEGRFGESETGLLATIAANVGIAIQNARTHSEIRRQKQFFESLVGISPVAVVVMDADERITDWNPAAAELFGYSAQEALGHKIDELVFHTGRREEGRELTLEALEYGRTQRIAQRERKDGTLVDVELMLVPLRFDGEHVGFYAIYHDITELQRARQEAEAATQAKSAFLATMSHEIRTPMNAVIGMTDLLLGTELTGEQREFAEVVRSSGNALLHVIDDILDYSKIEAGKLELEREPLNLRECVEGALEIVAPRAWEKGIELGCLIDEDAPRGIVGDAARLRQVLLNLLSNAVKFTEDGEVVVLVEAEPAAAGSYRLELAVRDTGIGIPRDRMDRLFTSFSQVDASTTRRYGGTGLGLAISKRLVDLMGGTIRVESEEGNGSTFHISLVAEAAHVPEQIAADDGLPQLRGKRVLIVDDNATNREIVTRHARSWGMEPVAVERPSEALELIDHGEPFDVAVLDMMMPDMDGVALAGQIRRRRSRRELPLLLLTSLGRLPHAAGSGEFEAQLSKPLRASQLYNALVRMVAADVDADQATETAAGETREASTLRILLAEDNAVNQKVALRLLERLGYGADVVWNGLEALAALERTPYDVVLMDVQMPELDGLDASRLICERWPPEARPRIVAMTANALPEDREACFAAGMDDYVAKPIRPDELAAALGRARPLAPDGRTAAKEAFDGAALENLRELGGDEFLAEVIDTFVADAPTLLETLRRSLEEGETEELRRSAHTLKSNGATLGAEPFAELCRELEQRAKDGRLGDADSLVASIEQEYGRLRDALAGLRPKVAS
jgi:PAS domain S-box-containing protein